MSTQTTYYYMTLPDQEDFYDVDILNENYSLIDEELNRLSCDLGDLATVAKTGIYNSLGGKPFVVCSTAQELVTALDNMDNDGGAVYLLQGTYEFTEQLYIGKNNVTIMGSGAGTVISTTSKLSVSGNNVKIRDLTLTRTVESTSELITLVTSSADLSGDYFELLNVNIACPTANASNGLIECYGSAAKKGIRLTGCNILSYSGKLKGSDILDVVNMYGIINNCWVETGNALTAPETMTLGANAGITTEQTEA